MILEEKEIQDFYNFLMVTGFIFEVEEVENGKYSKLITELEGDFSNNDSHYYEIANKWGTECRLYFYNYENLPKSIKDKMVNSYNYGGENGSKSKYNFRINDNDLLLYMVKKYGLRVCEHEV